MQYKNLYMEETTRFFSLRFIALSGLPPSWPGWTVSDYIQASPSRLPSTCPGHLPPQLDALSFPSYSSFLSVVIGFKSVHKMALHVIFPVKGFCYGSTTPRPYPARSLPALLWHRCTNEVLCGPQLSQSAIKIWLSWDSNLGLPVEMPAL